MNRNFAALSALAVLALASAAEAAEPKYSFKMTTWTNEGSEQWNQIILPITDGIKLVTDGQVEIRPYPFGQLAGVFEGHKAVLDGRADIAFQYAPFEVNEHPANSFPGAIPGGMGPYAVLNWLTQGGGEQLWVDFKRETQGTHPIFCGMTGTELYMNSHKKVQKLEDLKGLRFRTAGAAADVHKEFGTAVSVAPVPEIFPLLERKAIDSAEYFTPHGNYKLGYHKIAKYLIYPGIHAPSAVYGLIMKKEVWDGFSEDIRKKFRLVCDAVTLRGLTYFEHQDVVTMKRHREEATNELVRIDPELLQAVRKGGRDWAEKQAAAMSKKGDTWMSRMMDSYYKFQDLWSENSDHTVIDARD